MQNFNLKSIYNDLCDDLSNEFQFNRLRLEQVENLAYDILTLSEQNAKTIIQIDKKMQNNCYNFSVVELQHINKIISFSILTDHKDANRFNKICRIIKSTSDDVEHDEQYVEFVYDVLHYNNNELDEQLKILKTQ
jgi:hypothetical protein